MRKKIWVIILTVGVFLAALCLGAILPAGTFGGLTYVFICAGGAGFFFVLMLLCKKIRSKNQPQEPVADFINTENNSADKTDGTKEEK